MEFEYGAKAWWTTELYLSGQTTANDSTAIHSGSVGEPFQAAAGRALDQSGYCTSSTKIRTTQIGVFWRLRATTACRICC